MTVPEIIQIIDLGGTLCFALLVWQELRGMRHESLALMREIKGFVDLKKN